MYILYDSETNTVTDLSIEDILEIINDGHSDDWEAYNQNDWADGLRWTSLVCIGISN